MDIIPAIDILDGKCVRLTRGDYGSSRVYNEDPLEVALMFESYGISRLHIVDLDGARSNHIVNYKVLRKLSSRTSLKIDFGGGVKSEMDVVIAFENGAGMVTVGSTAALNPELFRKWLKTYGPGKIILGADAKDGRIQVGGWKEEVPLLLEDFIGQNVKEGVRQVLCTDINRDGMLQGPAVELYGNLLRKFPGIYLIASGGVSSMEDLQNLRQAGVPAAIVGKAFYEGLITIEQLMSFSYDQAADNIETIS